MSARRKARVSVRRFEGKTVRMFTEEYVSGVKYLRVHFEGTSQTLLARADSLYDGAGNYLEEA